MRNPLLNPQIVKLLVLCMLGIVLPHLNGEPITGSFAVTSDKPTIKSLEFRADGTVDVTSAISTSVQIVGKWTTVVKKETVRANYTTLSMDDAITMAKEVSDTDLAKKLTDYKEKKYEQFICFELAKALSLFVIKGKEIVSLNEGHIYKKGWW